MTLRLNVKNNVLTTERPGSSVSRTVDWRYAEMNTVIANGKHFSIDEKHSGSVILTLIPFPEMNVLDDYLCEKQCEEYYYEGGE